MNSNAKKWVKALRSKEFKQTRGFLCNTVNNSYCCLGVACEVYQKEVGDLSIKIQETIKSYDSRNTVLPPKAKAWLGLYGTAGEYWDGSLIHLNDKLEKDFDEIADVIESEPEGLFVSSDT